MDEISLYEHILGIQAPWFVEHVELDKPNDLVKVSVTLDDDAALNCPECQRTSPRYDKRRRQWRHLDTCQLQTFVEAEVPRIQCKEHGCRTIQVPWADDSSRYTVLFERLVLDMLHTASLSAVCRHLSLSWNAVDRIMQRAIDRGLSSRASLRGLERLYVDETGYLKQRQYMTIVSNALGQVVHVADGHRADSLSAFYKRLNRNQLNQIQSISMDMSAAYIRATREHIPRAKYKIAFDRFHVVRSLTQAVDQTRMSELHKRGGERSKKALKGSRYLLLKNGADLSLEESERMARIARSAKVTARAWELKELAKSLWTFRSRRSARRVWNNWCQLAESSDIKPMHTAARAIRTKLWGIVNACFHQTTNAQAESINSKIKMVKTRARGFRNPERFKRAIMFYCGGLDLYPRNATHCV